MTVDKHTHPHSPPTLVFISIFSAESVLVEPNATSSVVILRSTHVLGYAVVPTVPLPSPPLPSSLPNALSEYHSRSYTSDVGANDTDGIEQSRSQKSSSKQ